MGNHTIFDNYVFANKKIAKYKVVIKVLNIISLIISAFAVISQLISKSVTGVWYIWQDIDLGNNLDRTLISSYLIMLMFMPVMVVVFGVSFDKILSRIDMAKIHECVMSSDGADLNNARIKILSGYDRLAIFVPIIIDFTGAFFFAMCDSAFFTNGYWTIIFARFLGSLAGTHICSYLTILFFVSCCNIKKRELSDDFQMYIDRTKKEAIARQKAEKIANDKIATQNLLEQCGMKFFLKYYEKLVTLPLRDIDVDENYSPSEQTERLTSAKLIIDNNYTKLAIDYILEKYSTVLSSSEIDVATKILKTL